MARNSFVLGVHVWLFVKALACLFFCRGHLFYFFEAQFGGVGKQMRNAVIT